MLCGVKSLVSMFSQESEKILQGIHRTNYKVMGGVLAHTEVYYLSHISERCPTGVYDLLLVYYYPQYNYFICTVIFAMEYVQSLLKLPLYHHGCNQTNGW